MKYRYGPELPDILIEGMQHHKPSDEAIRRQTLKYIAEDFHKNGHKYSQKDCVRIQTLLLLQNE